MLNSYKLGAFGLFVLIIAIITAGPLIILWSLNTLFPALAIDYNFWTWLAALCLGAAVRPNIKK